MEVRYQPSAAPRKTIKTKRSKRIAAQEKLTKCKGTGASENNSKKQVNWSMEGKKKQANNSKGEGESRHFDDSQYGTSSTS